MAMNTWALSLLIGFCLYALPLGAQTVKPRPPSSQRPATLAPAVPPAQGQHPYLLAQLGHSDAVNSVAFSPDGRYVLTGSNDKTARLWETATGKEIRTFRGHTANVLSVAFSPDGRYVLTGSGDKTARLWETATGKERRRFQGHAGAMFSVTFSPDG